MTDVYRESQTKTLLLPREVERVQAEADRITQTLSAPPHISAQIQDRRHLQKQLHGLKKTLEEDVPKPIGNDLLDTATRREKKLREEWLQGMPTQAEMRRNPAGAVGKHQGWEHRNKSKIREWKNIRRRLHVSGDNPGLYDDPDISNIERYRPVGGPGEMNMHNEAIPGTDYYMPADIEITNVMPPEDAIAQAEDLVTTIRALVNAGDETAGELLRQAEARLQRIRGDTVTVESPATIVKTPKPKRTISPEVRAAARQRMLDMHAKKRAEKERLEMEARSNDESSEEVE